MRRVECLPLSTSLGDLSGTFVQRPSDYILDLCEFFKQLDVRCAAGLVGAEAGVGGAEGEGVAVGEHGAVVVAALDGSGGCVGGGIGGDAAVVAA